MSDKLEKDLKEMFDEIPKPADRRDRAMFVAGVAARRPPPIWRRALVPAAAMFVVLFALSIGSLEAAPGQTLYPLRNALSSVGLAEQPVEVVDRVIRRAEISLERAEDLLDNQNFAEAKAMTRRTLNQLAEARALLEELNGEPREERADAISDLDDDAFDLLEDIDEEQFEAAEEAGEESGDDDSSGSGFGSDDDSSGPGSDDSDDSGSGSDDDSSGSGSGSDDDSSGSGSGSDSGSSGSGSDD